MRLALYVLTALVVVSLAFSLFLYELHVDMSRKVEKLSSEVQKLSHVLGELEYRLELLSNKVGKLGQMLDDLRLRTDRLHVDIRELKVNVKALNESLSEISQRVEDLYSELVSMTSDLDQLRQQVDVVNRYYQSIREEITILSRWVREVLSTLRKIEELLYGRAYGSSSIFLTEPSPPLVDFVQQHVEYSSLVEDLRALSVAVYRALRYDSERVRRDYAPVLIARACYILPHLNLTLVDYDVLIQRNPFFYTIPELLNFRHYGVCRHFALLYMVAAELYLALTGYRHSVLWVGYVGRFRHENTVFGHAIVMGCVVGKYSGREFTLTFLADPTWRGYFTYILVVGRAEPTLSDLLELLDKYKVDNNLEQVRIDIVKTFRKTVAVSSLHDLLRILVSDLHRGFMTGEKAVRAEGVIPPH